MIEDWKSYEPLLIPDIPDLHRIDVYEDHGGYDSFREVLNDQDTWSRENVINEVKEANIRGRGGAGFNAGLKWSFMPDPDNRPRYLACNGDESEPGTFKDRNIMEFNPHMFIEGALIAAYAMAIDTIYVYVRGEYINWVHFLEDALEDAYDRGLLGKDILGSGFDVNMEITYGAGAYICGEETGMLESLEGKRGYPRVKPPFPAQKGLWDNPTTINNVATLANVPLVLKNGADWYKNMGVDGHNGPVLYGISGHVKRPGVYEYPAGMSVQDLIYDVASGIRGDKELKALIPGGASTPVLRADQLEGLSMDANSLNEAGSLMGTAGMVVMDADTDMVEMLWRITHFFHHESCGQCTPCREGTGWFEKILIKIKDGNGEMKDLDLLMDLCTQIEGRTICALADAACWPVKNTVNRFREEFEAKCKKSVHAVA